MGIRSYRHSLGDPMSSRGTRDISTPQKFAPPWAWCRRLRPLSQLRAGAERRDIAKCISRVSAESPRWHSATTHLFFFVSSTSVWHAQTDGSLVTGNPVPPVRIARRGRFFGKPKAMASGASGGYVARLSGFPTARGRSVRRAQISFGEARIEGDGGEVDQPDPPRLRRSLKTAPPIFSPGG